MPQPPAFYVVWEGFKPGIYSSWEEARRQIQGFPQAKYKRFASREEAQSAFQSGYGDYLRKKSSAKSPRSPEEWRRMGVLLDSLAVDAACSGNPGIMEYRGVWVATGKEVFRAGPFPGGTNNIGEFLALVHALAWLHEKHLPHTPIYSDSYNARKWVGEKKCRTMLKPSAENQTIFDLIRRAESWLQAHPISNPILKWDTEKWGENPADFGRK
jgi:ribonuclease HI